MATTIPQRPLPDIQSLKDFYVGKHVRDVPKPAAILDAAKIRRHCSSMLDTVQALKVDFRPHVKTHKTREVTRLQVGDKRLSSVDIVFSTLAELEHLTPFLNEIGQQMLPAGERGNEAQCEVTALYGIPLPPSQVSRLATLGRQLKGKIIVMIDHARQLDAVIQLRQELGYQPRVFLKVDTGYHRAGLPPDGLQKDGLVDRINELHSNDTLIFYGLYSHSSLSYSGSNPESALEHLESEISGCETAWKTITPLFTSKANHERGLKLSVGASPQILASYHLLSGSGGKSDVVQRLEAAIKRTNGMLEFHAGVYSILDMQQITTNAKAKAENYEKEISITVAAEVISLYNDGEREQPEALLAVGGLGLGREPCAHYKGWGVIKQSGTSKGERVSRRLIVTRISQEHSIVSWEYDSEKENGRTLPPIPLEIGQTVEIFPNHACITGAMYDWYLVVDSDVDPDGSTISDVWVRTSGW